MNKNDYLTKFAEKLSLTIGECEAEFNVFLTDEKDFHKDLTEAQQEQRALQRLALSYKKQLRSPAIGFEGIIIGLSDCVDIVEKQKREAREYFKIDPQSAITAGVTDGNGVPLDTRKEWNNGRANNQFGKPLPEHNFLRNIWGVAKKAKEESNPRFFNMVISGEKAQDETIPIFKPVKFLAIDKGEKLNSSQFTKFIVDENIKLPDYKDILKNYCAVSTIKDLETYHVANKDNFNRLVCVEGDISLLNLEPTAFGSRIMVLEDMDDTLENLDSKSLTCWLPERINVNYAEGSKVIVVGRTAQGKKKDDEGNVTEELGDVTLNVFGVYAIPEFKVSFPDKIKPITEESLDIK